MKAAILNAYDQPLEVAEVQIDKPGPREVLLKTAASGVCRSDLHIFEGKLDIHPPLVAGHEPAGVVERVGSDVRYVKPGDRVIACVSIFCGVCEYCIRGRTYLCVGRDAQARRPGEPPRLSREGEPLFQCAQLAAYAEQMLVPENALVKVREEMPLDRAALVGCAVTTGVGAVLRTAKVEAGSTVAVVGCGGVGLSIVQGSRIAGASRIIGIDTQAWKLELARKLGATDGVDAQACDAVEAVRELTRGGVDYAFEAIGLPATVRQAFEMTKKGATFVMVGVPSATEDISFPGLDLVFSEKRILGSLMGSNAFRVDMPRYVDFYLNGQLLLDEMITARRPLDEINLCFDEMKAGTAARSVIVFED